MLCHAALFFENNFRLFRKFMICYALCYVLLCWLMISLWKWAKSYALLCSAYAGTIICEQNLRIPYEIDYVHAENNELGAFRKVEVGPPFGSKLHLNLWQNNFKNHIFFLYTLPLNDYVWYINIWSLATF